MSASVNQARSKCTCSTAESTVHTVRPLGASTAASSPMPSSTLGCAWRNSASSRGIAENSASVRERADIRGTVHESADGCAFDGYGDHEHGALGRVVGDAHRAVVTIDQATHDRKA